MRDWAASFQRDGIEAAMMRRELAVPGSELTCREFVGLIGRLRDDDLSNGDRRSFLRHRQKCVRCAHYLKGYELTISATKRVATDSGDRGETAMPKSLVSRILGQRKKRPNAS